MFGGFKLLHLNPLKKCEGFHNFFSVETEDLKNGGVGAAGDICRAGFRGGGEHMTWKIRI